MFKQIVITIVATIVVFAIFSFWFSNNESPKVPPYLTATETKVIQINNIELEVEVADQPHEQTRGLSERDSLAENGGMLFVFPKPDYYSFWMKDMHFPLDMIWIDENKKIVGIQKNVSPNSYPQTFFPPSPIKYVLEVNAGWSDRNNVKVEDRISF